MIEKENTFIEKKEILSKKLEEYSLAKKNSKATTKTDLLCTFAASALLTSIVGFTIPILIWVSTVGVLGVGSLITIIRSKFGVPNMREIKRLSKEISEFEITRGTSNEMTEQQTPYQIEEKVYFGHVVNKENKSLPPAQQETIPGNFGNEERKSGRPMQQPSKPTIPSRIKDNGLSK